MSHFLTDSIQRQLNLEPNIYLNLYLIHPLLPCLSFEVFSSEFPQPPTADPFRQIIFDYSSRFPHASKVRSCQNRQLLGEIRSTFVIIYFPRLPPPQPSNPFQCLRQLTIIFGPAKVIVPLISPSQFVLSPPTPHLRPPVLKSNEKSRLGQSAVAAAAFLSFVPNKTANKQIP